MAAAQPTREDTWSVSVKVADRQLGIFDSFSGGEIDSEEAKYAPGGMAAEISLGGRRTNGNVTVGRYLDRALDWPLVKWLASQVGGARVTIGVIPLAFDGSAGGAPLVYSGTLKTVTLPDIDSTGSDVARLELECTMDGSVA
jgi:hypothetical protein